MLKTKSVSAVAIELADGVEAVFVPDGPAWHELRAYKCIAPAALAGELVITAPALQGLGPMEAVFADIFGTPSQSTIVMATPKIQAAIKAVQPGTGESTTRVTGRRRRSG